MKRLLTILMFISFLPTTASAGFADNKTVWDDLSNNEKEIYIMGVFDTYTTLTLDDSSATVALKIHRFDCVVKMPMGAQGLIDLVDTVYQNDISLWQRPPFIALTHGLQKMCGDP